MKRPRLTQSVMLPERTTIKHKPKLTVSIFPRRLPPSNSSGSKLVIPLPPHHSSRYVDDSIRPSLPPSVLSKGCLEAIVSPRHFYAPIEMELLTALGMDNRTKLGSPFTINHKWATDDGPTGEGHIRFKSPIEEETPLHVWQRLEASAIRLVIRLPSRKVSEQLSVYPPPPLEAQAENNIVKSTPHPDARTTFIPPFCDGGGGFTWSCPHGYH